MTEPTTRVELDLAALERNYANQSFGEGQVVYVNREHAAELLRRARQLEKVEAFFVAHGETVCSALGHAGSAAWLFNRVAPNVVDATGVALAELLRSLGIGEAGR